MNSNFKSWLYSMKAFYLACIIALLGTILAAVQVVMMAEHKYGTVYPGPVRTVVHDTIYITFN